MSRELRCNDLMPGCGYVARGATDEEVIQQAAEHAREVHDIRDITPELAAKVKSAIREA